MLNPTPKWMHENVEGGTIFRDQKSKIKGNKKQKVLTFEI